MNSKDEPAGASQRVKNNLLTLGSAAVLAVYAAGFIRTRAAAQRFSDASDQRRGPPPAVPTAPADTTVTSVAFSGPTGTPVDTSHPAVVATTSRRPAKHADTALPATAALTTSDNTSQKPDSQVAAAAAQSTKPEPQTPPPTANSVDTAVANADKAVAGYKNGTYRGWGTSRHGDIEAAVEIKDGRIAAAYITQCLTRYSCSWISHLPPQVVARQSPEVDYVSGATQSTNAFYYAIVQALSKAK